MVHPHQRVPPTQPGEAARPFPRKGGGPGSPGEGEGPAPAARRAVYARPPPTEALAPGSTNFRVQGRSAAQVLAGGEVVLSSFRMPTGQVGIIRIVEFDVNGLLVSSDITFRIRLDGGIPLGWEWQPFATAAAFFAKEFPPESTYIRVPETGLVEVTGQIADAGTYDLGCDVQGWHYGSDLRDGYEAAWAAVL